MKLVDAYKAGDAPRVLYRLLKERTPQQSISHEQMPTWDEHVAYVRGRPYPHWYLIEVYDERVGMIYISQRREVGIGILSEHQRRGYGSAALAQLRTLHPGPLYANVAPLNWASHAFFRKAGGVIAQATYRLEG